MFSTRYLPLRFTCQCCYWTLVQWLPQHLSSDPIATKYISADGQWSTDLNSLLLLNNKIYIPSTGNLYTHVLQYNHNYILAGHYGQNKTLELIHCRYSWPSLYADVQQFYKFCVTCIQSKLQYHKPYRFLKQLPIPG